MMKIKLYALLLVSLMIISLAGCGKQVPPMTATDDPSSVGISADVTSDTSEEKKSDDITAENMSALETENEESAPESNPAEEKTQESLSQESAVKPPAVQSEPPRQAEPPQQAEPSKPQEPKTDPPQPVQPQTPAPKEPAPTEPESPTEPTTEPPTQPTVTEPEFNINDWIDYAKSYAESVGLRPESSAVDCWDNPITAGAHSAYLKRDIESRLNRYSRDEDITDVWIWAEKSSDGSYDLYIGYA